MNYGNRLEKKVATTVLRELCLTTIPEDNMFIAGVGNLTRECLRFFSSYLLGEADALKRRDFGHVLGRKLSRILVITSFKEEGIELPSDGQRHA